MAKPASNDVKDQRRRLVEQVAASPYFSKSARLREMFIYVCDQVLDHEVEEIHEQEVGRRVFGRPADYDTSADNTVRVHASMLRKRVDQYFANEGSDEPVVIEIPRGNYAPVFHERSVKVTAPEPQLLGDPLPPPQEAPPISVRPAWHFWLPVAIATLLAVVSVALFLQVRRLQKPGILATTPTVRQLWGQVFQPSRSTDLVVGDAALSLYEERTGHSVALSEYFDRSYLNSASNLTDGAAKIDPDFQKTLLLKRQTNYGDVALLALLTDIAHAENSDSRVRFARDYSFREIKSDNAVLLGNTGSDPWVEPFQSHQTLHWRYDADRGSYYPVDSAAASADQEKYHVAPQPGQPAEGYAIISLFPNIGGTGTVLIISGTGGTAMNGALAFLTDEHALTQLRSRLSAASNAPFPYFEALLRIGSRNTLPRDSSILVVRPVHQ